MEDEDGSITSTLELRGENVKDLQHLLLHTSLQLESARQAAKAQEQMYTAKLRELERLLQTAERERDEARQKFEAASIVSPWDSSTEWIPLQSQDSTASTIDSEFIIPDVGLYYHQEQQEEQQKMQHFPSCSPLAEEHSLPQRGKLLQAVVQAGPLLHTLLIAGGPLPQWHCPPPGMGPFLAVLEAPFLTVPG